jgi:hypothetical protein
MPKKRFTAPTAALVGEIALERLGLLDMEGLEVPAPGKGFEPGNRLGNRVYPPDQFTLHLSERSLLNGGRLLSVKNTASIKGDGMRIYAAHGSRAYLFQKGRVLINRDAATLDVRYAFNTGGTADIAGGDIRNERGRQLGRPPAVGLKCAGAFAAIYYFLATGQRTPDWGPTKTPVFMHWAAAASQSEGFAVTRVASRTRPIPSLQFCAPSEHDVGCR